MAYQLNDIRIFVAIVEAGSFIGAAKKLAMPASTVSRRVAQLERDLSLKLIKRDARNFNLTEAGQALFESAQRSVEIVQNQVELLTESHSNLTGTLTVTCPVYLGQSIVGDWLREFARLYPKLKLKVLISDHNEDFAKRPIDLAIRFGPLADSGLYSQYLLQSDTWLVASEAYLSGKQIDAVDQLAQHRILMMSQRGGVLDYQIAGASLSALQLDPAIESNDIRFLKTCALHDEGIACLPAMTVSDEVQKGQLVRLLSHLEILPTRELYAVYPDKRYQSEKVKRLIQFVKQKAEQGLA